MAPQTVIANGPLRCRGSRQGVPGRGGGGRITSTCGTFCFLEWELMTAVIVLLITLEPLLLGLRASLAHDLTWDMGCGARYYLYWQQILKCNFTGPDEKQTFFYHLNS